MEHASRRMPSRRPHRKSSRSTSPSFRAAPESSTAAADNKRGRRQTNLDTWVEPRLRDLPPSFVDNGLDRGGVLEGMQPLGTLPPLKFKISKSEAIRRPAMLRDMAVSVPETPEVTPPLDLPASKPVEAVEAADFEEEQGEMDKDYVPNGTGHAAARTPKTSARHGKRASMSASRDAVVTPQSAANTYSPVTRTTARWNLLEQTVKVASNIAEQNGRPKLGTLLERFYIESKTWEPTARLLDTILDEDLSEEQRMEFKMALKRIRADVKAERLNAELVQKSLWNTNPAARDSLAYPGRPDTPQTAPAIAITKNTPTRLILNHDGSHKRHSEKNSKSHSYAPLRPPNLVKDVNEPTTNGMEMRLRSRTTRSTAPSHPSQSQNDDEAVPAALPEAPRPKLQREAEALLAPQDTPSRRHRTGTKSRQSDPAKIPNHASMATSRRETRSSKNRPRAASSDSVSSLSSVDEKIVNAPPPTTLASKRSAEEAGIDQETDSQRKRLLSEFEGRRADFRDIRAPESSMREQIARPKQSITLTFNNGRTTRRRARDETEGFETPLLSPNPLNVGVGNSRSGRSVGPPARHVRKTRTTGARTKISPIKDRSTVAGVARNSNHAAALGSGPASPSRGNMSEESMSDDNVNYCVACGGSGTLLCCDGCENAFHLNCCDPPLKSEAPALEEPWYCYSCTVRGPDLASPTEGAFGPLLESLRSKNAASFQLPKNLREYFEGVATKSNGEYHDISDPRVPIKRANTGWEETGADGKVKEKDAGKLMFCKMCGESSLSGRTIIQCDVCPAQWHCDCLDPPQANPPAVAQNGRTRGIFRCPLHVTQDLRLIGNPAFAYTKPDGSAVRGHKLRRPKQPRVIKPAIGRGLRNNGVVEVELEEPEEVTIQQEDGVVYRLTEQSIKLDFIERVKQRRRARALAQKPTFDLDSLSNAALDDIQRLIGLEVQTQVNARLAHELHRLRDAQDCFLRDFGARPVTEQQLATQLATIPGEHQSRAYEMDRGGLELLSMAVETVDPIASAAPPLPVEDIKNLMAQLQNYVQKAESASAPADPSTSAGQLTNGTRRAEKADGADGSRQEVAAEDKMLFD